MSPAGDTYERLSDAAEIYIQNHPLDYPGFASIIEIRWAKRVAPAPEVEGIKLLLEGIPAGLEQRGLVLSRGGFTYGRVKVLGGAVYPTEGIAVNSQSVDGGSLRYCASPEELFPDPAQIPEGGVNLWELGASAFTAVADPEMPGESKRFLVMAGASAGDARAQATHGSYASAIPIFVSPHTLTISPGAINLGHPDAPEPPSAVTLSLTPGEGAAEADWPVLTGGAADNGMTVLGGKPGYAARFTVTRSGSVSPDGRSMPITFAAQPGTSVGSLTVSQEVRCRHNGRQKKAQMLANANLGAIRLFAETATDNFLPGIPDVVGVGEPPHTTRVVLSTAGAAPAIETANAATFAAPPGTAEKIVIALSGTGRINVSVPPQQPYELNKLPSPPSTATEDVFGYITWTGAAPGPVTFNFTPQGMAKPPTIRPETTQIVAAIPIIINDMDVSGHRVYVFFNADNDDGPRDTNLDYDNNGNGNNVNGPGTEGNEDEVLMSYAGIINDDDLLAFRTVLDPLPQDGRVVWKRDKMTVFRVWKQANKSGITSRWLVNDPDASVDLSSAAGRAKFQNELAEMFLEGIRFDATALNDRLTVTSLAADGRTVRARSVVEISLVAPASLTATDGALTVADRSPAVETDEFLPTLKVARGAGVINLAAAYDPAAVADADNPWQIIKEPNSGALDFDGAPGKRTATISKQTAGRMIATLRFGQAGDFAAASYRVRIIVSEVNLELALVANRVPGEAGANVVSGQPFALRLRALRSDGSVNANYQGTVHFTSLDARAVLPPPPDYQFTPDDHGVHEFAGVILKTVSGEVPTRQIEVRDTADASIEGRLDLNVWFGTKSTLETFQDDYSKDISISYGHGGLAGPASFAALPSTTALGKSVVVRYGNISQTAPVWDIGPWNIDDPYWTTTGVHRPTQNGSGMDLSDVLVGQLGINPPNLNPDVLWRFQ